jgi:hypothetical protein
MIRSKYIALLAAAVLAFPAQAASQDPPPAKGGPSSAVAPIDVPVGNGVPVITDGIFSPGEWDDARATKLNADINLYVKEYRGVVFVGVRGGEKTKVGPTELSLAVPGGPISKLHASAQLYEVELPANGPEPAPRFGLTAGWYANELRRDVALGERLQKEGKSPMEIVSASAYPNDGIEFAIRRSKFPGNRWLARVWVTAFVDGAPWGGAYPPDAAERTTDGWLELRLR